MKPESISISEWARLIAGIPQNGLIYRVMKG